MYATKGNLEWHAAAGGCATNGNGGMCGIVNGACGYMAGWSVKGII